MTINHVGRMIDKGHYTTLASNNFGEYIEYSDSIIKSLGNYEETFMGETKESKGRRKEINLIFCF